MVVGARNLGDILIEQDVITPTQLEEALERQRMTREFLGRTLVGMGYATEQDIINALGIQQGMEQVELSKLSIPDEVLETVSADIAQFYNIVPIRMESGVLTIAMADPLNINILDDLKVILGFDIVGAISTHSEIAVAIERLYGQQADGSAELMEELVGDVLKRIEERGGGRASGPTREEILDVNELTALAHEAPVIQLINLVILRAVEAKAADLHFEPFEEDYQVRMRVDGVLIEIAAPPKHLALAVSSRIKVMSNLDIAEKRLPQDGRIQLTMRGKEIDMRVSVLPTMFGESVVIRILDKSAVMIEITGLGLDESDQKRATEIVSRPNGIVLVTGPTGSGKTTTLYACLNEINRPTLKIITTEDPVEYNVPGIIQVPVNEKVGLTFARCLRSILRQDPDIVMVGEIRDLETAGIAVEASLTGHLVLSTVHTNDAPSTITRLIDMGIEPFLLSSTIEGVIAQRLVRRLCMFCRESHEPTQQELELLKLGPEAFEGKSVYRAVGCPDCHGWGYRGRVGLFEVMELNDDLRDLIMAQASTMQIRSAAVKNGMVSLRRAGISRVVDGTTTIDEVLAVTMDAA